jgi:hypothetical protein
VSLRIVYVSPTFGYFKGWGRSGSQGFGSQPTKKAELNSALKLCNPNGDRRGAGGKAARPVSARAQQLKEARTVNAISAPSKRKKNRGGRREHLKNAELNSEGITMSLPMRIPAVKRNRPQWNRDSRSDGKSQSAKQNESKKKSGVSQSAG